MTTRPAAALPAALVPSAEGAALLARLDGLVARGFTHRPTPSHQARRGLILAGRLSERFLKRPLVVGIKMFWGERMKVVIPELSVSRVLVLWRHYEPDLTRLMLHAIRPGATVIDVGAHFGYYTLLASRLAGPAGKVIAFEPTPSTFEILRRNAAARSNVDARNAALHATPTELELRDFGWRYSAQNTLAAAGRFGPRPPAEAFAPHVRRVPAYPLDDIVEAEGLRPDVVKVDAESSELEILRGMERTIKRHHPAVSLEVGDADVPGAPRSATLVRHLLDRGYAAWQWTDRRLERHVPADRYEQGDLLFVAEG